MALVLTVWYLLSIPTGDPTWQCMGSREEVIFQELLKKSKETAPLFLDIRKFEYY